ncbi:hypothetical protein DBV05_g2112 [Lasiodiplodia theobromae]|uniref:Fucose-specific lectin n=1 Tax=Lasiodiplodia theobromae TaxID=45133 RepID=A0A5N5DN27_9PEZI|nr:hypothetical protein DBV05_g2112 [Lasiodiplodia theobromae]
MDGAKGGSDGPVSGYGWQNHHRSAVPAGPHPFPHADSDKPLPYNSVKEANSPTSAAVPDHENYPEVYNISEVYPEVVRDGTLPEAVVSNPAHSSKEALEVPEFTEETRLRRNRLRISILIALLVVVLIIAIVGGIVGSGVASRRQSTTEILDTTALASVSYKRADGVSQYRVYFQTTEGELCQSVWDSETGKWTVSPLRKANAANITGEPEVKLGTPLAAHIYGSISSDEYEYHLFFLDINNKIFELVSHDPDDMWKFSAQGALKGNYTAASFSSLASYGRQCGENCGNASSVVVWQNDDDKIMLAGYEASHGWASFSMNASIVPPPVHGTSITILSLGANEGVMSIYVNNGSPTQLHFNITDGWTLDGSLSGSIDPDAALTGLITNYDNATAETADVKIIATKPESSAISIHP